MAVQSKVIKQGLKSLTAQNYQLIYTHPTHTLFFLHTFQIHYHNIFTRTWEVIYTNPITAEPQWDSSLFFSCFFQCNSRGPSLALLDIHSICFCLVQFQFPVLSRQETREASSTMIQSSQIQSSTVNSSPVLSSSRLFLSPGL